MTAGRPAVRPDEAFRRHVGEALDAAYSRAAVILGDRFEAEDAVHDAAERAWRRWSSLREPDRFDAWFGRILVNECRDRLRRRRRLTAIEAVELDEHDLPASGDDGARLAVEQDRLRRLLATLAPDDRISIVLRYDADLTVPAIASLLGVPEGTVKSRLHRALGQLRAVMGGSDDD